MKLAKLLLVCSVLCFSFLGAGCAWQKIPPSPEYSQESSIPVKVGIVLKNNQITNLYGPMIIEEWKQASLFDEIIYPYRKDDVVDAVLELDVSGQWVGSGAGVGVVIGLTLGLASPFVGPSIEGNHSLITNINVHEDIYKTYTSKASTKIGWGLGADVNDVGAKADKLLVRKLAVSSSNKLRDDREAITGLLKK